LHSILETKVAQVRLPASVAASSFPEQVVTPDFFDGEATKRVADLVLSGQNRVYDAYPTAVV
jgi:hypothetical protein